MDELINNAEILILSNIEARLKEVLELTCGTGFNHKSSVFSESKF